MNTNDRNRLLSLNHSTIHTNSLEQLVSMWSVISKCKDHLEEGIRLENLSWRQWYHQHQQTHSSLSDQSNLLSLSAGPARHEVSQKQKETQQKDQVLVKKGDDWSFISEKSSTSSSDNRQLHLVNSNPATPPLSNPHKVDLYDDDDDDYFYDEYDDDIYDDDDLYDDDDNYIYQEDDERAFMHIEDYFQKKALPQPLIQRPSLLSALFKTPPSSSASSSSSSSSSIGLNVPDHFLTKEWTNSLRDNVLWEHVQQKPFFSPPKKPDYHQAWSESFHGW
ncbi:hypothetical protein BC941DRAFT_419544 [Chlamydoabsidia padenii]|nr:hypothetical protein BC941DRAFT_419544 [Chlamydoabsidia padenii]